MADAKGNEVPTTTPQARCCKCDKKVDVSQPRFEVAKNMRHMCKGQCSQCGKNVCTFCRAPEEG